MLRRDKSNIIFYSRRCRMCQDLLVLLKNTNFLHYFSLLCIDDNIYIPPEIKKVPTMIVYNINRPLVANEIFKWIHTTIKIQQQTPNYNQQLPNYNQQYVQQNQKTNSDDCVQIDNIEKNNKSSPTSNNSFVETNNNEMCNISDFYTCIDEGNNNALDQSYVRHDQMNMNIIFTEPEFNKISEKQMKSDTFVLMHGRNNESNEFKQDMLRQQANVLTLDR